MSAPANLGNAPQRVKDLSGEGEKDRNWPRLGLDFDYLKTNGLVLDLMPGYSDHP